MQKHLFQWVSRGSSSIIHAYGCDEKKMKQKAIAALLALILISLTLGIASAQTTVEASSKVVKPGETITITGTGAASSDIQIEISNSRGALEAFNITSEASGQYDFQYQIPDDAPVDIYTIKSNSEGETAETTFMVSHMTQQQVANTIKTMVIEARKQAETALIEARKQGYSIPQEVRDKYSQGLAEIQKATNAIQSQNYVSAQGSLQEAMNLFREVVEYTNGEEVVLPVKSDQLRYRVQEKLEQLVRQYNAIKAAVGKLRDDGVNVETLQQELETLRAKIGEAKSLLDEGKIAEADQSITQTQLLVSQRLVSLRQKQAEVTKRLAERYQIMLETRVQAYVETFQMLQAVRPAQSALALQELETLRQRLLVSGADIDNGNLAKALLEMKSTEYRLKRLANTG